MSDFFRCRDCGLTFPTQDKLTFHLVEHMGNDDDKPNFEGHEPRYCGDHRTVGSHRAWCHGCSEWCYPRIEMACKGCLLPATESLMDDLADVLARTVVGWEPIIGRDLAQAPEVERVMKRYREFKGRPDPGPRDKEPRYNSMDEQI